MEGNKDRMEPTCSQNECVCKDNMLTKRIRVVGKVGKGLRMNKLLVRK